MNFIISLIGSLTGLGGAIRDITGQITNLKIAQVNAGTDEEKARLQAQIEEAHDRRSVLVAEAGSRINAIVRAMIAAGPGAYILKYFLWDKVVGSFMYCAGPTAPARGCELFITDGLNSQMAAVMTAVIAFYFCYDLVARFRK